MEATLKFSQAISKVIKSCVQIPVLKFAKQVYSAIILSVNYCIGFFEDFLGIELYNTDWISFYEKVFNWILPIEIIQEIGFLAGNKAGEWVTIMRLRQQSHILEQAHARLIRQHDLELRRRDEILKTLEELSFDYEVYQYIRLCEEPKTSIYSKVKLYVYKKIDKIRSWLKVSKPNSRKTRKYTAYYKRKLEISNMRLQAFDKAISKIRAYKKVLNAVFKQVIINGREFYRRMTGFYFKNLDDTHSLALESFGY